MSIKRTVLAGVGAGALLVTAACGGEEPSDPRAEFRQAALALSDQRATEVVITVDGDAEGFNSLNQEGDSPITEQELDEVLSSSVVLGVDRGEDREDPLDDASSFELTVAGTDAGELRSIGTTAYAQVMVDELVESFPSLATQIDQIEQSVSQTPELASVQPLLDGEWVSVEYGPDSPLGQFIAQQGGGAGATPSPEQVEQVWDALEDVLAGATVEEESDGHLVAEINARSAYQSIQPVLAAQASTSGQELPDPAEVPDQDVRIDVYLNGEEIERAELDITQFSDTPSGLMVLKMEFSERDAIEAPDDARAIDLAPLLSAAQSAPRSGQLGS